MKKILKVQLFILLVVVNSYSHSLKEISLVDYIEIVSHTINKNIYITDEVSAAKVSLFLPINVSNEILIENLKSSLFGTGFTLRSLKNSYIIEKEIQKEYFTYQFKNVDIEDIEDVFNAYEDSYFAYMKGANAVFYKADKYRNIEIQNFLEMIDIPKETATIKVNIIRTDLDKLFQFGTRSGKYDIDLNDFSNYIFGIYGTSTTLKGGGLFNFKTSFDVLNKNDVSKIEQSPTLYLTNGKNASVKYVDNIPYLVSVASVQDGVSTTQETTEYKDVGIHLNINPKINNDEIFLNFDLIVETLLTNLNQKPTTRKIQLNQSFKIKKGEVVLLSGLSRTEINEVLQKVPLLGDIPVLDFLFKYKEDVKQTSVITVMVEYL